MNELNNFSETIRQAYLNDDIYQAIFSIKKFEKKNIIINNANMRVIIGIIKRCKLEDKYKFINVDEVLQIFPLEDHIDFDIALEYYALSKPISNYLHTTNNYSYTLIYTKFKERLANFNGEYKELGVCLKLLNNPCLVYKNLHTIVNRINMYYKKDIDRNFINCCLIIKSVILYDCRVFESKTEYLKSLLCFLIDKIENVHDFYDSKVICTTAKHIINLLEPKYIKDFLFGKYQSIVEKLNIFVDIKTDVKYNITIYEEQLLLANFFYLMHKTILFLHKNGVFTSTSTCVVELLKIDIYKKYETISHNNLQTYFYKSKYQLLNEIITSNHKTNTQNFVDDLTNCKDKHKIVKKLNKLIFYVDLNYMYTISNLYLQDLAVFICKLFYKSKFNSLEFEFFRSLITSIKDNKILALCIYYAQKHNTEFCTYKISIFTLFFQQSFVKPKVDKNTDLVIAYILKQKQDVKTKFVENVCSFDFVNLKILDFLYLASTEIHRESITSYFDKFTKNTNLFVIFYVALIKLKIGIQTKTRTYTEVVMLLIISIENQNLTCAKEIDQSIFKIIFSVTNKQYKTIKDLYLRYKDKNYKCKTYESYKTFEKNQKIRITIFLRSDDSLQ